MNNKIRTQFIYDVRFTIKQLNSENCGATKNSSMPFFNKMLLLSKISVHNLKKIIIIIIIIIICASLPIASPKFIIKLKAKISLQSGDFQDKICLK